MFYRFLQRKLLVYLKHEFRNYNDLPPKHLLQLHPFEMKSLKERLKEKEDEEYDPLYDKVDIGFRYNTRISKQEAVKRSDILHKNKKNPDLEESARLRKLFIDINQVETETWQYEGPSNVYAIANHYNIYQDLFGLAYFYPVVPLDIAYMQQPSEILQKSDSTDASIELQEDTKLSEPIESKVANDECVVTPVYYGNIITSHEAQNAPLVNFPSSPDKYWTLLMTSLDSHFTAQSGSSQEYVHWLIANIPGNDITKGQTLVPYIRPFYPQGAGYHRYAFVLFQQSDSLVKEDLPSINESQNYCLQARTWSTLEFYRKFQSDLTPAGLSFFQGIWDDTLRDFFHHSLKMRVPRYRYEVPLEHRIPNQKSFPSAKFDTYFEQHRDPMEHGKEVVLTKLARINKSPFVKPAAIFPDDNNNNKNNSKNGSKFNKRNVERINYCQYPTYWEREREMQKRLGWGKYAYLYRIDD